MMIDLAKIDRLVLKLESYSRQLLHARNLEDYTEVRNDLLTLGAARESICSEGFLASYGTVNYIFEKYKTLKLGVVTDEVVQ